MISEQKFRVETPYGVKIFQNLHFQKHPPIMEKGLAKKNFNNKGVFSLLLEVVSSKSVWCPSLTD